MNTIHDGDASLLGRVDLNLIVAFDVLARERSVTRAAERLGVTQSAMSHSLRRLRELVGDPLLVRGARGMVLTPRAEALAVPLRGALVTMARALGQPAVFDPRTVRRAFRLATPDLFDVLAIPPLLERIRSDAPGVDVSIVPLAENRLVTDLETGDVDVAIVPQIQGAPLPSTGILRRTLFEDGFVCFLRRGHPALAKRRRALSLDVFTSLSHALVSPAGEGHGFVDAVLEAQGRSRRIALRIPHFFSALAIVAKSDLVLTAPTALARLSTEREVVTLTAPIELPRHRINLVWHERFSKDAGHQWLREVITDVANVLLPRSRART